MTPEQQNAIEVFKQQVRYHLTGNQPLPAEMLKLADEAMDAIFKWGRELGFVAAQQESVAVVTSVLGGTPEGDELAELIKDEIKRKIP